MQRKGNRRVLGRGLSSIVPFTEKGSNRTDSFSQARSGIDDKMESQGDISRFGKHWIHWFKTVDG